MTESLRSAYRMANAIAPAHPIPQEPLHCSPKVVAPSSPPQAYQPLQALQPQQEVSQEPFNSQELSSRPRFIQSRAALKDSLSPLVYPVTVTSPSTAQSLSNMQAKANTRLASRNSTPRAPTPFEGVHVRAAPRSTHSAGAASLPQLR